MREHVRVDVITINKDATVDDACGSCGKECLRDGAKIMNKERRGSPLRIFSTRSVPCDIYINGQIVTSCYMPIRLISDDVILEMNAL